mmetsp:Transcript_23254/g.81043  ORF Transcript_23254/g.81043 Transcript_23254/m.81043 type:complete len:210 (+) Transcript_23254:1474-2103(+)
MAFAVTSVPRADELQFLPVCERGGAGNLDGQHADDARAAGQRQHRGRGAGGNARHARLARPTDITLGSRSSQRNFEARCVNYLPVNDPPRRVASRNHAAHNRQQRVVLWRVSRSDARLGGVERSARRLPRVALFHVPHAPVTCTGHAGAPSGGPLAVKNVVRGAIGSNVDGKALNVDLVVHALAVLPEPDQAKVRVERHGRHHVASIRQ